MIVVVLKRIIKRIGVDKKDEEGYEKAIKPICLGKDFHPSSYKKREEDKTLPPCRFYRRDRDPCYGVIAPPEVTV
jgi:hypothetical protein